MLVSRDIGLYHVQPHLTWFEPTAGYRSWPMASAHLLVGLTHFILLHCRPGHFHSQGNTVTVSRPDCTLGSPYNKLGSPFHWVMGESATNEDCHERCSAQYSVVRYSAQKKLLQCQIQCSLAKMGPTAVVWYAEFCLFSSQEPVHYRFTKHKQRLQLT